MSEHNLGIQIEVVPNSMLCSGNRTKTVKNQGTFQTLGWKHKVGGDRRGEISAVGTKCHTMTLLTFCLVEAGVLLIHSKRFFSAKSQNVRLDTEVGKECLWGGVKDSSEQLLWISNTPISPQPVKLELFTGFVEIERKVQFLSENSPLPMLLLQRILT